MAKQRDQVKVLVAGDVCGKFEQLFKRVAAVNKKAGPFEMLICVGEFFGDDTEANDLFLQGAFESTVPAYIMGPCSSRSHALYPSTSGEIAPNITYLGRKGLLSTASGLTVAYLSGLEKKNDDHDDDNGKNDWAFDFSTVNELLVPVRAGAGYIGVDLLLTSCWPAEVTKYAPSAPSTPPTVDSELVSKVSAALKPRYHFAGMNCHYERSPYRNHRVLLESAQHTTRFIGLAAVDNPEKQKWLYAFGITPLKSLKRDELVEQPENASEFPYMDLLTSLVVREREEAARRASKKGQQSQFFYDMNADQAEDTVDRGGKRRHHQAGRFGGGGDDSGGKRAPPQPCWFCLSSPDVEKHMIISVADSCYLALAKGGLTDDHVLILPVGHIQSLVAAPEEVRRDVQKFKHALSQMFAATGKCCVFFERNYRTQHLQVQAVPIPVDKQDALQHAFTSLAELKGFELSEIEQEQELWDIVNEGCPYFYLELPDGCRMVTRQMKNFPIQFGREAMASGPLLNMPEKADWRACSTDKDTETKLAKSFQKLFAPYDFTEEDGDSD